MQRTVHTTLADDLKEQAEVWLQAAKERIAEIDEELKDMHAKEKERSSLLQQVEHLERVLTVEPSVVYVKTERTQKRRGRRTATPDGRTIADHITDILEETFPQPMHWTGILRRLHARGIGAHWKSPLSSIRMAVKNDKRVKQMVDGEYIIVKEQLTPVRGEVAASREKVS